MTRLKTEAEIRERIIKINMQLKRSSEIKTQQDLERTGIRGLMLLSERYALWWVLGEVRKHQRSSDYPGSDGIRRALKQSKKR